jgi:hypothetical protein
MPTVLCASLRSRRLLLLLLLLLRLRLRLLLRPSGERAEAARIRGGLERLEDLGEEKRLGEGKRLGEEKRKTHTLGA